MSIYKKQIHEVNGLKTLVIETERLLLESFEPKHLMGIHALTEQTEIQQYLSDWIATPEQRREWMEKYEVHENHRFICALPDIDSLENDPLRMAIRLKATDEIIGWIVSGYKVELPKPNREIGYAISNVHVNKGFATEASKALMDFIFKESTTKELVATAMHSNGSSNKVLTKIGYVFQGVQEIDGHLYNCYRVKNL